MDPYKKDRVTLQMRAVLRYGAALIIINAVVNAPSVVPPAGCQGNLLTLLRELKNALNSATRHYRSR